MKEQTGTARKHASESSTRAVYSDDYAAVCIQRIT